MGTTASANRSRPAVAAAWQARALGCALVLIAPSACRDDRTAGTAARDDGPTAASDAATATTRTLRDDERAWIGEYEVDRAATYERVAPSLTPSTRAGFKGDLETLEWLLPTLILGPDGRYRSHASGAADVVSHGGHWRLEGDDLVLTTDTIHGRRIATLRPDELSVEPNGYLKYRRTDGSTTVPAIARYRFDASKRLVHQDPRGLVMRRAKAP